jgi:hypothetical protein
VIEPLRSAFNASWTESAYETYKDRLAESAGSAIGFRICESPVFLPPGLRDAMVQGALEIWADLLRPEALERSKAAVPAEFDVPASDDHPLFAQADFAIVEIEGRLVPRLIELQGFPSLYAFQLLQGRLCLDMVPGHGEPLEFLLSDLDDVGYRRLVGDAILGSHPVENVVLLDLDPPGQGTYPDFAATEKLFGIRAVCPTEVTKSGRELWYERDGKRTRILRVYNRLIVDEIVEKKVSLPFRFTDELDVEWAGHPNWFFRWSKHALPGLRHPLVPEARLLSDFDRVPDDLSGWVLKPLFSFSGSGVKVDVTAQDLAAVPEKERSSTLLMRKVDYAPVVQAPDGGRSRVEVRVMFVWRDGKPVTWVGSTSCLWPRS